MTPILSIIIPCYNHGKYIQETLDSIEFANYKDIVEVIIVNDGSTDEYTISKLKDLEKQGWFVLNQSNSGLAKARNNGIELAKGKYILPLDSDNLVLKPYLSTAIDILEKNELIDIVYGNAIYFGEEEGSWIIGEHNLLNLVSCNYIDACAVFRKKAWEKIGGYDDQMPVMGAEDWDFWIKCSLAGFKFHYLNDFCFNYRVLSSSMIHAMSNNEKNQITDYIQEKYRKNIDLPGLEWFFNNKNKKNKEIILNNLSGKEILKLLFLKLKKHFN